MILFASRMAIRGAGAKSGGGLLFAVNSSYIVYHLKIPTSIYFMGKHVCKQFLIYPVFNDYGIH